MALITFTNPLQKFPLANKAWFVLLLLVPMVLYLLPGDYFDEGQSLCPSKAFFNIECFGCGMTRAVMHFHHFEFSDAIFYNYGVVLVYPILVVYWFILLRKSFLRMRGEKI